MEDIRLLASRGSVILPLSCLLYPRTSRALSRDVRRELVEAGAEVPAMFEFLLTSSLEAKGTDWDMLGQLLRQCAEESVLKVSALTPPRSLAHSRARVAVQLAGR